MTALYRGALTDAETRRATTQIAAFVVDTKAPTLPPPPKSCSCCGESVSLDAWMGNGTRRPWTELGLEIAEHHCDGTLAEKINGAPVVLGPR